jgi:enamine deaminase RidA (YjgF/YER057c/UK114 family)
MRIRPGVTRDGIGPSDLHEAVLGPSRLSQCELSLPVPCGAPAPCGATCRLKVGPERHSVLDLGTQTRLCVIAVPASRGSFRQQAEAVFAQISCIVATQRTSMIPTMITVFLRDAADAGECAQIISDSFAPAMPVTTLVVQPPCCGAALGVELWAVGGPGISIQRLDAQVLTVQTGGIRWVYCGGIGGSSSAEEAYTESLAAFGTMQRQLARAGANFDQVVRTWIYLNDITIGTSGRQRYQELNRARTDFYRDIGFGGRLKWRGAPDKIYPASTGIGTRASHLAMSCLALESKRPDVFVLPLENPQQTPAYSYHARYSPDSPKFSRAMAVVQGHFIDTFVSGTASIVNAKTRHIGDVGGQTEQTIENIERLISPANFERHGLGGTGATLQDIGQMRVYLKHLEDYERCREICEKCLPRVPAIYLHADVCRPDLLVEIEAVAVSPFSGCTTSAQAKQA